MDLMVTVPGMDLEDVMAMEEEGDGEEGMVGEVQMVRIITLPGTVLVEEGEEEGEGEEVVVVGAEGGEDELEE